jgi:hypothetical protein
VANLSVGTDPLTANTYTYVNGDPLNLTDPNGHCSVFGLFHIGTSKGDCLANAVRDVRQAYQGAVFTQLASSVTYAQTGTSPGQGAHWSSTEEVQNLGAAYGNYLGCISNNQGAWGSRAAFFCASLGIPAFQEIYDYLQRGGNRAALAASVVLGAHYCQVLHNCGTDLSGLIGAVAVVLPLLVPGGEAAEPAAQGAGRALAEALGVTADATTEALQAATESSATGFLTNAAEGAAAVAGVGARDAAVEATTQGQRFVRIGAGPQNLKWTFEHPGGTGAGTYAVPEEYFNSISHDPAFLKDIFDLPDSSLPQYFRILEPPAGTPIQYGTVPGGEFGGSGGAPEGFFPKGY